VTGWAGHAGPAAARQPAPSTAPDRLPANPAALAPRHRPAALDLPASRSRKAPHRSRPHRRRIRECLRQVCRTATLMAPMLVLQNGLFCTNQPRSAECSRDAPNGGSVRGIGRMGATSTLLLSVTMRVSLRAAWHAPIADSARLTAAPTARAAVRRSSRSARRKPSALSRIHEQRRGCSAAGMAQQRRSGGPGECPGPGSRRSPIAAGSSQCRQQHHPAGEETGHRPQWHGQPGVPVRWLPPHCHSRRNRRTSSTLRLAVGSVITSAILTA
jgi:hypothetical protein